MDGGCGTAVHPPLHSALLSPLWKGTLCFLRTDAYEIISNRVSVIFYYMMPMAVGPTATGALQHPVSSLNFPQPPLSNLLRPYIELCQGGPPSGPCKVQLNFFLALISSKETGHHHQSFFGGFSSFAPFLKISKHKESS